MSWRVTRDAHRSSLDHDRRPMAGTRTASRATSSQIRMRELQPHHGRQRLEGRAGLRRRREHSALAYFSNFVPRLRWGMALIPREGEPRLLISMSSRDVPAMKLMTWIPDVRLRLELGERVRSLARAPGRRRADRHRRGRLRPDAAAAVRLAARRASAIASACMQRTKPVAADRTLRPRELSQMRAASRARAGRGRRVRRGLAHRQGRRDGRARCRAHRAPDGGAGRAHAGELRRRAHAVAVPRRVRAEDRRAALLGYIAVKHMGYWADMFVSAAGSASDVHAGAQAGLAAIAAISRAPAPCASEPLRQGDGARSAPMHCIRVLSGSVGRRIGLSLDEGGDIRRDSRHTLGRGEVYALARRRATIRKAGGALTSAMIAITAHGLRDALHARRAVQAA